jgi:hypothetical protein
MERDRANVWHSLLAAPDLTTGTGSCSPAGSELRVSTRIEEKKMNRGIIGLIIGILVIIILVIIILQMT